MCKVLQAIEDCFDEFFDAGLIVGVSFVGSTLGYDAAYGHSLVTQEACHALEASGFHLEVGDMATIELEAFDLGVEVGVGEWEAKLTTLGGIEADSGNGVTSHHIVAADTLHEFGVSIDYVRSGEDIAPAYMLAESLFEVKVADPVAIGIEIEYTLDADTLLGDDIFAKVEILLKGAGSADTHDVESAMLRALAARSEVDIGEGIELGHHDLDIVGADAVRDSHDRLAVISAADGMELARADLEID